VNWLHLFNQSLKLWFLDPFRSLANTFLWCHFPREAEFFKLLFL
jgi:hypothetical protein